MFLWHLAGGVAQWMGGLGLRLIAIRGVDCSWAWCRRGIRSRIFAAQHMYVARGIGASKAVLHSCCRLLFCCFVVSIDFVVVVGP